MLRRVRLVKERVKLITIPPNIFNPYSLVPLRQHSMQVQSSALTVEPFQQAQLIGRLVAFPGGM